MTNNTLQNITTNNKGKVLSPGMSYGLDWYRQLTFRIIVMPAFQGQDFSEYEQSENY